jgi:hypothetical protein
MQRRTDVTMIEPHSALCTNEPENATSSGSPAGIPGRAFRTGFGLQYKLRREKRTADKLINKSPATARAIILQRAALLPRSLHRRTAF